MPGRRFKQIEVAVVKKETVWTGTPSGFQCALVRRSGNTATIANPRYGACGAVSVYRHLATGRYTFYARAVDSAGSARKPARRSFSIG